MSTAGVPVLRNELLARLRYEPATIPALCIDLDRKPSIVHAALTVLEDLHLVERHGTKRVGRRSAYVFYAVEEEI